jgi:hypothetical protein
MHRDSKHEDSQSIRQNNVPDGALPHLSESDIQELISFFRLLAKWDREANGKSA